MGNFIRFKLVRGMNKSEVVPMEGAETPPQWKKGTAIQAQTEWIVDKLTAKEYNADSNKKKETYVERIIAFNRTAGSIMNKWYRRRREQNSFPDGRGCPWGTVRSPRLPDSIQITKGTRILESVNAVHGRPCRSASSPLGRRRSMKTWCGRKQRTPRLTNHQKLPRN